jgi:FkbM family methyltransferase
VEPDPWLASLLRRSAGHNRNSVDVLSVAVSDRNGLMSLNIAQRGRATNFLSGFQPSTQTGGVRSVVQVVTVTLDWLLEQTGPPAVVKIDVEGAEAAVLGGAVKVLGAAKPRLVCEVSEANRAVATRILRDHGYTLYDASRPFQTGEVSECAWNTIALPEPQQTRSAAR